VPSDRSAPAAKYRVYGMSQSYFTRKLTGSVQIRGGRSENAIKL